MLLSDTQLTQNYFNPNYEVIVLSIKDSQIMLQANIKSQNKTEAIKYGHEYALRILNLFPNSYVVSVTKMEKEGNLYD